jgi:hemin uptake protein HemP
LPEAVATPFARIKDRLNADLELPAGGREANLIRCGERYRLRDTTNDKLILTK